MHTRFPEHIARLRQAPGKTIRGLGSSGFWPGVLLLLMAVANGMVLLDTPLAARVTGMVLIVFVLPGSAFINLIFARCSLPLSERIVLSAGASAVLSVIALWLVWLLPWPLQTATMVGALDAILILSGAGTVWWQRRGNLPAWRGVSHRERATLAVLTIATVVGLFYCFANLQYGDLSFDERHVVDPALEVLLGKKSSLFALPKGPEQILMAMWSMRLTGSLLEAVLRFPFALTGMIATAALVLIARLRLKPGFALLAGLAIIFDSLLLGWFRSIQYQGFVFAMVHLVLYCALRGWRTRQQESSARYWWLCAFFAAAGLLGHYSAALIAPAVLYLFMKTHQDRLWSRRTWLQLGGLGATVILIGAPYYLLLLRQPQQAGAITDWYVAERVGIGQGPFNNLNDFFWYTWDLNSAYQAGAMFLAIMVAGIAACTHAKFVPNRGRTLFVLSGLASLLSIGLPDVFTVAGYNLSFVPLSLLCGLCIWKFSGDPFWVAVLLWAFVVFGFTGFWMKIPFDQYNVALPALWLIAAYGFSVAARILNGRVHGATRVLTARTALSVALAWFSLSAGYSYLLTIAHYPETLRAHPERAPVFFGQLASARITEQGFNVTNAGWRVIAALYANGELRGESDSTAPEVQNWYLAKSWAPPRPAPRYFFVAQAQKPKYPERIVPADLEQTHDLWGTVIVNGEPQIKIYQRRNGSTLPKARNLRAEDYESAWAQLASLGRFEQLKGNQRDDSAFYMLGQVLQTDGRPGDAIILDNPLVQTILNLYYRGDLPYLDLRQPESPAAYQRIWGIFRGSGGGATERALAESAYPASSQWIGNIHVRLYGVVPDGPLREAMSNLGEVASLLRSSTLPSTLHAGQLLPVRLIWQARQATEIRYKVFVHVTDSRGLLVAQADDEPQAGLRPTDGWQAGEIINDRIGVWLPLPIPPGRYQVTIGLYDPASGARLAAVSQDGARTADDAVPLGDLLVVGG